MITLQTPFFQKCALLGGDGSLVQNGQKGCALSQEELQTDFIQDVVIDIALTRCELMYPIRFINRIQNWKDFWPMWLKIKTSQPLPKSTLMVEKYVPSHIRKYIPLEKPSFIDHFLINFFAN